MGSVNVKKCPFPAVRVLFYLLALKSFALRRSYDERFSLWESCVWVGGWALFVACGVGFVPTYLPTNIYLTSLIGILCYLPRFFFVMSVV